MNAAMIDAVRKPKQHKLKTWPVYFDASWRKLKPFELRVNDRDFRVNDTLTLQEFEPCEHCRARGVVRDGSMPDASSADDDVCPKCKGKKGKYLGREVAARVTYILLAREYLGLEMGHCILGLKFLGKRDKRRKK